MALREDVTLDFANAIREINRVETIFDSAFAAPIPVTLDTSGAVIQQFICSDNPGHRVLIDLVTERVDFILSRERTV